MHIPTPHVHIFFLLLFLAPNSQLKCNKAVLLTDAKINLGWGKYFYSAGILKIFEIPTKTSESFLYPPTYFVQREILKFLPIIYSFLHSPLNNEKGQFDCVCPLCEDRFHQQKHVHAYKQTHIHACYIYSLSDKAMKLCL